MYLLFFFFFYNPLFRLPQTTYYSYSIYKLNINILTGTTYSHISTLRILIYTYICEYGEIKGLCTKLPGL